MDKIYFRTALTILLLLVFVAVITANLRYLLIIAISLAVNMAIAFLAYYFLRVEIQLYSLAGITISLNLVIDNLIVMTEHVSRHRTLRAFSAVLAATLTTVGALTVVFFLDEKTLLSLKDFTVVVIVNLGVSLAVALFLVPALVERMGLVLRKSNKRKRRLVVRIYRIYGRILTVLCRFRWIVFIIFAAAFGWSIHVFVTKVYEGGYFDNNDREPVLEIAASLPNVSHIVADECPDFEDGGIPERSGGDTPVPDICVGTAQGIGFHIFQTGISAGISLQTQV